MAAYARERRNGTCALSISQTCPLFRIDIDDRILAWSGCLGREIVDIGPEIVSQARVRERTE